MTYRLIHRLQNTLGTLLEVGAVAGLVDYAQDNSSGLIYASFAGLYVLGRILRDDVLEKKIDSRLQEKKEKIKWDIIILWFKLFE